MPPNLDPIVECFRARRYLITKHGYEELDNDSITIQILESAIGHDSPEIIEDNPNDPRGHSCLIQGWFEPDLSIHVLVGIATETPKVITAYRPNSRKFYPPDFRRRK